MYVSSSRINDSWKREQASTEQEEALGADDVRCVLTAFIKDEKVQDDRSDRKRFDQIRSDSNGGQCTHAFYHSL
ncbi:unnamed protein product [Protopolystoma xenopodis]|uniref:Uncharacterized protein n=1 Tax=Protopolystoma xenopodis TaxID=117903 RepID=A0A3S5BCE1_9PLAT|nr:unnamed protein product [Protopolystoma xenopodis]